MRTNTTASRAGARRGSALIIAVVAAVVLAALGGNLFLVLQQKYTAVFQSSAWHQALVAAEAGVDVATSELRTTLMDPDTAFSAERGWIDGDQYATQVGVSTLFPPSTLSEDGRFFIAQQKLVRRGEGGTRTWFEVFVDVPPAFSAMADPWYRVRSVGYSEMPGPVRLSADRRDTGLRKMSLVYDRHKVDASGDALPVQMPNGSRVIETILRPVGAFDNAILGDEYVRFTDHNVFIDSYNSETTDQSITVTEDGATYTGQYPGRGWNETLDDTWHADVATNGPLLDAGDGTVYGKAKVAEDGEVTDADNIKAGVEDGFHQDMLPVKQPLIGSDAFTPPTVDGVDPVTDIDMSFSLESRADTPARFQFDQIRLSGNDVLTLARPADAAPGGEYFIEIVVTGDVSTTGNARIVLEKGVYLRLFVQGNVSVGGGGFVNGSRLPVTLQLYGLDPLEDQGQRRIDLGGNAAFYGAIYAPNHEVSVVGGGNMDSIFGSITGQNVTMTGIQSLHYDEALKKRGLITDYRIVSWVEDTR